MKNNDFDFISSKFEEENITPPESLQREQMKNKISTAPYQKVIKPKRWKTVLRTASAAVAALAVIIGSSAGIYHYNTTFTPKAENVKDGIVSFDSYDEVEKMMKAINNSNKSFSVPNRRLYSLNKSEVDFAAENEGAVSEKSADSSYAKTNVQVEGIDESDVIKTDGKYIYYVPEKRDRVIVYVANGDKPEKKSEIRIDSSEDYFENIFLNNNRLFVIGTTTEEKLTCYKSKCFVRVYSLDNIEEPEKVNEYCQSGDFLSARMFGGTIYLVSSYNNYFYEKGTVIPYATCDGSYQKIPFKNYYAIKDTKSISYSVLGAIDINDESYPSQAKAVFGVSNDIYCNENNIYLFGTSWEEDYDKTHIVKFSIDKTDVEIKASKKIDGRLINQYALDEKDGYLRVATTSYNSRGDEVNNLFVLDKKLRQVGSVDGFARNESIRAVKYIGDTAYVITYEQTDPLFVIDLSKADSPKILGEAKIDGFSTLLMPVDDNTLLGIGYLTETVDYGYDSFSRSDGLKLTLFDVSDKLNPKVLDTKDYRESYSTAQQDAKALIKNENEGYFAIPVSGNEKGVFVIRIDNKKISVDKKGAENHSDRITYIGDYIYSVNVSGDGIEAIRV